MPTSKPRTKATTAASTKGTDAPGPLVSVDWLAAHLEDPDVRLVHVSPDRRVYNKRHIAGAAYSDLHKELALKGTAPETGDAEREWLVPAADLVANVLRRWRVGDGDRIVFYDDVGLNRQAIRGYWLLRLYRFPADRLHILDGGIDAWRRAGHATTTDVPEADLADGLRRPATLGERDDSLIATYDEVLAWSDEAAAGPDAPTQAPRRADRGRVRGHGSASPSRRAHPGRAAAALLGSADRRGHVPSRRRDAVAGACLRRRSGADPRDLLPGWRPRRARVVRAPRAGRLRRPCGATRARGRSGATAPTARSRRPSLAPLTERSAHSGRAVASCYPVARRRLGAHHASDPGHAPGVPRLAPA